MTMISWAAGTLANIFTFGEGNLVELADMSAFPPALLPPSPPPPPPGALPQPVRFSMTVAPEGIASIGPHIYDIGI